MDIISSNAALSEADAGGDGSAGVGTAPAAVHEPGPSFVNDVETAVERIGEGVKDDVEQLADRVIGTSTFERVRVIGGEVAKVAEDVAMPAIAAGGAAYAALKALGAGHVSFGQLSLTAELSVAKIKVEDAILALARHIGGANVG